MFSKESFDRLNQIGGLVHPAASEIPEGYVVESFDESTETQIIVPIENHKVKVPQRGPRAISKCQV